MENMFDEAGKASTNYWTLNLSNWNICSVNNHNRFNSSNGNGVITVPNWNMECPV